MMRRRYAIAMVWVYDHAGCIRVGARLRTLNSAAVAGTILNNTCNVYFFRSEINCQADCGGIPRESRYPFPTYPSKIQ